MGSDKAVVRPGRVSRARRSAPTQLTGGGGFSFEDQVAAVFLARLVAGDRCELRPNVDDRVLAISWQVAEQGWRLDDLLMTFGEDAAAGRLALSVKRDRQVTGKGFPPSFVRSAWLHWIGGEGDPFDCERDLLGLAPGLLDGEVLAAWSDLLGDAIVGKVSSIAARFGGGSGGGSRLSRALFASLRCPADLAGAGASEPAERVMLLRRIRLLHFEFRLHPSTGERGKELCRRALASGDAAEGRKLWKELVRIAAERRPHGGHLDRHELLVLLAPSFDLVELPDHRADWRSVAEVAADATRGVKTTIGATRRLERAVSGALGERLGGGRRTLLIGLSGSGKSALAKAAFEGWKGPRLWLDGAWSDAEGLVGLRRALGVGHALAELLREASGAGLLVLDGVEGWTPRGLANAAALLDLLRPLGNWTVLATTRPAGERGFIRELEQAMGAPFEVVDVELLSDDDMRSLARHLPWLGWLWPRPGLNLMLRNLKVLDWLGLDLTASAAATAGRWVTPSDVHDAVWGRWCGSGADQFERSELLRRLARAEAEAMRGTIGLSDVDPAERRVLGTLVDHELIERCDNVVRFRHDLGGDWARLQVLIEERQQGNLEAWLPEHARSPRWHAAIRLYGERLLDRGDAAATEWCGLYDSLGGKSDAASNTRALLLDSLVSASPPGAGLERLWPRLIAGGGELLIQVLRRFLFVETVPAPAIKEIAGDEETRAAARANWRVPRGPFWAAVLATLYRHRQEVVQLAAPEVVSHVAGLWLRYTPLGFPLRREAAALALEIATAVRAQGGAEP
jgi:hypothetical protein